MIIIVIVIIFAGVRTSDHVQGWRLVPTASTKPPFKLLHRVSKKYQKWQRKPTTVYPKNLTYSSSLVILLYTLDDFENFITYVRFGNINHFLPYSISQYQIYHNTLRLSTQNLA